MTNEFVFERSWLNLMTEYSEVERLMLIEAIVKYKLDKAKPKSCIKSAFQKIRPLIDGEERKVSEVRSIDQYSRDCDELVDMLKPYEEQYGSKMLNEFYLYWKEPTKGKNPRARYTLNKTWDVGGRLRTWNNNNKKYSNGHRDNGYSRKQRATEQAIGNFAQGMERGVDKDISDIL